MSDKPQHRKPRPKARRSDTARSVAVRYLDEILDNQRMMSELRSGDLDARLAPEERARAQRLALDVLRWLERCDRMLDRQLRKAPPLHVRNILRLGTFEICTGGASHGVVNDLVSLTAGHRRHGALKGLVNAVLRRVAEQGPEEWDRLRMPRMPKWLRRPLVDAWGADAVAGMEAAHARGAALDITPAADTATLPAGATALPTGSYRLERAGQVTRLDGYSEGQWWVQDAAAALPVQALSPKPKERILDLCAAPGGKTCQLAAAGAKVTAVDISAMRMARVQENLARVNLTADCRVADALDLTGQWDAVLLDAPCSATGTMRRHPELPFVRDGAKISDLIALQTALIDHAWTLIAPGGRLVFCTCSLLPDEGEVQVADACQRHPDMQVDRDAIALPGTEPGWQTEEGGLRLRPDYWPDIGGLDGFYIAVLRKPA